MFDEIDRAYFHRLACEERERSESTTDVAVAKIHRALAEEYQRKADEVNQPLSQRQLA